MKEKELQKQLDRIQRSLERKQIIEIAKGVARKYGEHKSETYPYRIKHWYNFSGNNMSIKMHSGWSDFGGEDLEIYDTSQRVFYVSSSPVYENFGTSEAHEEENQIKIGELYIHQYTPGKWERQLNLIYKNGLKKEKLKIEKPIEREVDKSKLEDLAARLPIKI